MQSAREFNEAHLEFGVHMRALVDAGCIEIPAGFADVAAAHERACAATAALSADIRHRLLAGGTCR